MAEQGKLKALIDWCQFRFFEIDPLTIIRDLLALPFDYFDLQKGRLQYYDYQNYYVCGHLKLYYVKQYFPLDKNLAGKVTPNPPKIDVLLLLSGEGCRQLERDVLETQNLSWKNFFHKVIDFVNKESGKFKLTRLDLAIDDYNDIPYFTPAQLLKYDEPKRFNYGRSTYMLPIGTKNKGMALYLQKPGSGKRIRIYDKLHEQADKQGIRPKDLAEELGIQSWIRLEIEFLRDYAQAMLEIWLNGSDDLMTVIKGYLKEQLHFYIRSDFTGTPKFWTRYLGKSEAIKLSIPKNKPLLYDKFNWFIYQGGLSVLKAYQFLWENELLNDYKENDNLMNLLESARYPPDLANLLTDVVLSKERSDLIPEIKSSTKKPTTKSTVHKN